MKNTNWRQFFGECATIDDLKRTYKRLARQYHPDLGGDLRMMQTLNNAFDAAVVEFIPRERPDKADSDYYRDWRANVETSLREAIERIITLNGLEIEICGLWVWVSGETRANKDNLREAGYRYHTKKFMWYFAGCPSSGRNTPMNEIRAFYGSQRVTDEEQPHRQSYQPSTAPITRVAQ